MKTIKDIAIAGKTVLVRADYNVPVSDGVITDDYRIQKNIPTLQYLLDKRCKIVIISHLGRPEGKLEPRYSLQPIAKRLEELLGTQVAFTADMDRIDSDAHPVTLYENLRFHSQEEDNDHRFAEKLATLGEVFVQDGFGVVHRAHASTDAITDYLPSVAGLLLETEVTTITETMDNPKHPLVAIMGGAKVSDKIELIKRMVSRADRMVIGGAMANTFLKYHGYDIGKSTYEDDQEHTIADIYEEIEKEKGTKDFIWLPEEHVYVSDALDPSAKAGKVQTDEVQKDEYILDNYIPDHIVDEIKNAGTIIWNGPVGMTEFPDFTHGSHTVAHAIKESSGKSIVGGGDTAGFIQQHGLIENFDWVSTGGGAALDLMAGKKLPGIAALTE